MIKRTDERGKMAVETNAALKEALYAQQQLLQNLYNELEVEREASSSAASEALAMILRLQGEKAGVKMEAEHYKRLAEEKMYHAEESMEIFEELIQQKEIEIATLDYQVQAYRYKLSSLGLEDNGAHEVKFPENMLQLHEKETSPENLLRRNSAPPKLLKYLRRGNVERNRSLSPDLDMISNPVKETERLDESCQNMDSEKQVDGICSYWDQIRKLDKIVEGMEGEPSLSLRRKSSQFNESDDHVQSLKRSMDDETISDTCNLRVHDVFEVPETNDPKQVKDVGKLMLEGENKVEKLPISIEDPMKSLEKILLLNKKEKQVIMPRDDIVVDCRLAINVVEGEGSSQRVNTTTEITESDVRSQEPVMTTGREEEMLSLLHEINKKLDSIQAETISGKKKEQKPTTNCLLQLQEAMLHFWL